MKRKRSGFSRFIAFALCMLLVISLLPTTALAAGYGDSKDDVRNAVTSEKIVDNSTMNDWEQFFDEDTTEYAGGVWTDKSVFSNAGAFPGSVTMMDANNNFLVALSALASNKEIVGYSTIPTDTMLILDLSQSMDNSGSIPQTITAANAAIDKLLKLNKNNRVGVVLYSGNSSRGKSKTSTGKLLLSLNRYTANSNGAYLKYTGEQTATAVAIADGLRYEATNSRVSSSSKTTEGGTYIQNGLDITMDEFLKADPVIEDNNIQGGKVRMPIFVLMSDGAPTTGDPDYNNIGESSVGNGTATSSGLGFMTQLTAAYARAAVEEHYGSEAKFYSLGLNLAQQDADGQQVSNSVLNPKTSLSAINTYWDKLFENGSVSFKSPGTSTGERNPDIDVTINRVKNDGLTRDSQYYVDKYFKADDNDALNQAFSDIVNEIILQSAYYPTLVEHGKLDFDGYLTFEDEIGQFMEVKNITGILLGNKLFSGAALTKMMASDEFGDRNTYTDLGWELVDSVSERIGVSQDVAITLLKQAWEDGQLSYTSDTKFSNYIGWYEGAENQYLGYWNVDHEDADIPEDAAYISRSYCFYGSTVTEDKIVGSDMMHIVVKVRTEIATGLQDVVFQIPASLIPILTYHITLDADNFDDAEKITLKRDNGAPIRLLFEVGLRSDINELNIDEVLAEENLATGQHVHKNPDGTYYFYSNQWGDGKGGSVNYDQPFSHLVTVAQFEPSVENERYYYIDDTVIATDEKGTPYKETTAPSATGATYYRGHRYFTGDEDDASMMIKYIPIAVETLANNAKRAEDGTWHIEEGTVFQDTTELFRTIKEGNPANPTGTLDYSDYPIVVHPDTESSKYNVYDFLGNNGRLTFAPATGIKLTKLVDATVTDKSVNYTFNVTLADPSGAPVSGEYTFVGPDGTYSTIAFNGNGVSDDISIKADETVYITGIPAGTAYTIAEKDANSDYTVASVVVDGVTENDKIATDTITDKTLDNVVFTNTERQKGQLIISKTITHDFGSDYVIPEGKKFDVTVEFKDAQGDALANGTTLQTTAGELTVQNGKVTLQLGHNESVKITELDEGIQYAVSETNIPAGFTLTTAEADLSGTIEADTDTVVALVNNYRPTGNPSTTDIAINVTKTVEDIDGNSIGWGGKEYKFALQQLVNDTWITVEGAGASGIATEEDNTFTLKIPENSLTQVGTYLFRVHEDEANLGEGMVSDTAVYFAVIVTDNDMDGSLEVASIQVNNEDVADKTNVDLSFTNTYIVTGGLVVDIPIKKTIVNETGVSVLPEGFEFQLYEQGTNGVYDQEVSGANAVSNANGDGTIFLSYTSEWFAEQPKNDEGHVELTYELREKAGVNNNISYSEACYVVCVEIGIADNTLVLEGRSISLKNADGTTGASVNTAAFENEYILTGAVEFEETVDATKKISGDRTELTETDVFEFELYETDSSFNTSNLIPIQTAENTLDGTIDFATVEYSKTGTHYYVIAEKQYKENGITSDSSYYHVTVVVTADEENGTLVAAKSIVKVGAEAGTVNDVVFNNVYDTVPAKYAISGDKDLTGKELTRGLFTFTLSEVTVEDGKEVTNEISTAVNAANSGAFTFPEIAYTSVGDYHYIVSEVVDNAKGYTYDDSIFEVTITVTDDGKGQLVAEMTSVREIDGSDVEGTDATIKFVNAYDPDDATISLKAKKLLDNRTLEAGEFKFNLYEADENFAITNNTAVASGTNEASGEIRFNSFTIGETGTFYYVAKEDASDPLKNVVYDAKEYQITVVVYDVGGALSSRFTYADAGSAIDEIVFSNAYFAPQTAKLMLQAEKTLNGRDTKEEEFSFELYQTGADYDEEAQNAVLLQTKSNDANNIVTFETIQYAVEQLTDDSATFYYVVKEDVPETNPYEGVTYDTTEHQIKVVVTDDGSGFLKQEVTVNGESVVANENVVVFGTDVEELSFVNNYAHSTATLTLGGNKQLNDKNLQADDFSFVLYQAADDTYDTANAVELDRQTNKADKTFTFETITISQPDTYYYVVAEVNEGDSKVDYDEKAYNIKVVAEDDGKGILTLDVYYEGKQLTDKTQAEVADLNFTNTYNPDDTVVNLGGEKIFSGRDIVVGEFTFILSQVTTEDGNEVKTEIDRASNDSDNEFAFDSLVFDKVGTYEYVVEEDIPTDTKGVSYDSTVYKVKVDVTNDGSGALSQKVYVDGRQVSDDAEATITGFNFSNSYSAVLPDGAGLELSAEKTMTGDRDTVVEGEFAFILSEVTIENGQEVVTEIETAENDADGIVTFAKIADYTEPGIYTYIVEELPGDAVGITYDGTVYQVKVEVTDDGEGNLVVGTPVITANGASASEIVFENVYTEPEPIQVVFNVTKLLENKTEEEIGLDGFEFRLTSGLNLLATAESDENGKAEFAVSYTVDDIGETYVYKISEVRTGIKGMRYDTAKIDVLVSISYENGVLVASVTQDGQSVDQANVQFTNVYFGEEISPVTGQPYQPFRWVLLFAAAAVCCGITAVTFKRRA